MSDTQAGRRRGWAVVVAFLFLAGLQWGARAEDAGAVIDWRNDLFIRDSHQEPVADVLRKILSINNKDMVVIVNPDVVGTVNFNFDDKAHLDLHSAFNKIMAELYLSYTYDKTTNQITIVAASSATQDLVPLQYTTPELMLAALKRLGVVNADLEAKADSETRSILLKGSTKSVIRAKDFISKIEKGAADRQSGDDARAKLRTSDLDSKAGEIRLRDSENRAKCLEEQIIARRSVTMQIIPVHFASVGPTTLAFQGEKISVPGMDATLRSLFEENSNAVQGAPASSGSEQDPAAHFRKSPSQGNDASTGGSTSSQTASGFGSYTSSPNSGAESKPCEMPKPKFAIDLRTNSVIVEAPPDVINNVKKIIGDLDKQMPSIDLEVMIVQAESGTSRNLGVQWGAATNAGGANGAVGISTGSAAGSLAASAAQNVASYYGVARSTGTTQVFLNGSTTPSAAGSGTTNSGPGYSTTVASTGGVSVTTGGVTSTSPLTVTSASTRTPLTDPITLLPLSGGAGAGLLSYVLQGSKGALAMQLNALQSQDKAQVLASPHVVTLNNVLAKITSKTKVSIPVTTGDGTRSDIKTVDAGLEMQITPSVIDPLKVADFRQLVRLNIDAKNSSFSAALTTDEKEVQSNVIVPDGDTFVLGGLFQDSNLEGDSGVVGLMDIPILGNLFRSKTANLNHKETIFFITPKLVDSKTLTAYDVGARDYMYHQRAILEEDRHTLQDHALGARRVVEDE